MATKTKRAYRLWFSEKESAYNTENATCFFESIGGELDFPEPDFQFEIDKGKIGAGEHGTRAELQAVWTPFTIKVKRFSEWCFFTSYFFGRSYTVTQKGTVYQHEFRHLLKTSRTLPSFTMQAYDGVRNFKFTGCLVNDISLSGSNAGNGVCEMTVSGFGNMFTSTLGVFALNTAGAFTTGAYSFITEPLVNFRSIRFWKADTYTTLANPFYVDFDGENLGANLVDFTTAMQSFEIKLNNGLAADFLARAGGGGVLNSAERGDRTATLDFVLLKDTANLDKNALIVANTKFAMQFMFNGPVIAGSDVYSYMIMFPVLQVTKAPETSDTPVRESVSCEVLGDSNDMPFEGYAESLVAIPYNGSV